MISRRQFCVGASAALTAVQHSLAQDQGLELDAGGKPGLVRIRGKLVLRAGQKLVLSPNRGYDGKRLRTPRPVRAIVDTNSAASLTIERGARLIVEGSHNEPIEWSTVPVDPELKPLLWLKDDSHSKLHNVSFINIGIRVEGNTHSLQHVSSQYTGDLPAFTFAGVEGKFLGLFAHHSTWGFSFEGRGDRPCSVSILDSCIRSCAKGAKGARYASGGAVRASGSQRHRIRFENVDWDPSWDLLDSADFHSSGGRPRIVALGDSIVQGSPQYVNFWNYIKGNDDLESSWPYLFEQRAKRFFVINKGEGGFITDEMLNRLPGIIKKIHPQYCFLGGGTNNLSGHSTPTQVFDDFRTMWRMLQAADIVPIQLAITPNSRYPAREDLIQQTNAMLRRACAEKSIRFEDVYTLLVDSSGRGLDKAYDVGGLHLNKAGYQKLANFLQVPPVRKS